jgi:lipoprotein-anchoring transpeptidase ErfK/SrfK
LARVKEKLPRPSLRRANSGVDLSAPPSRTAARFGVSKWGRRIRSGPRWVTLAFISFILTGLIGCATAPESRQMDPSFARQDISYATREPPGTIVIDPSSHFLYLVQGGGKAVRYGVGIGAEGFRPRHCAFQAGMAGLVSNRRDAGEKTRDPAAHGAIAKRPRQEGRPGKSDRRTRAVPLEWQLSSGCIRLTNEDIVDLYNRARVGTKVVVLNTAAPATTGALPVRVNSLLR